MSGHSFRARRATTPPSAVRTSSIRRARALDRRCRTTLGSRSPLLRASLLSRRTAPIVIRPHALGLAGEARQGDQPHIGAQIYEQVDVTLLGLVAARHAAKHPNRDTLMLAGARAEARLLNQQARAVLAAAGELDVCHEFEIEGCAFAPGEQVVLRRNDPAQHLANGERLAVDNGMRATITGLNHDGLHVGCRPARTWCWSAATSTTAGSTTPMR